MDALRHISFARSGSIVASSFAGIKSSKRDVAQIPWPRRRCELKT